MTGGAAQIRIDVLTIFPEIVDAGTDNGVIGRARRSGLLDIRTHDVREQTSDVHQTVDDSPFGGGAGMVMMPQPIFDTVAAVSPPRPLFLLGPAGRTFDQELARELAATGGFSLLCGRYEGIDHRVRSELVDGELSIGDVVLAGGEAAALVVIEAVGRLVPGVLGNADSSEDESFSDGLLEYPHYTRPAEFAGHGVPEVLRSGDHGKVKRWRRAQALHRTVRDRPDLIERRGGLSDSDESVMEEFGPIDGL